MLKQRIITGVILAVLLLLVVSVLPRPLFTILMAIILMLAAWEWTNLSHIRNKNKRMAYLLLQAALFSLIMILPIPQSMVLMGTLAMVWWPCAFIAIWQFQRQTRTFTLKTEVLSLLGLVILLPFAYSVVVLNSRADFYDAHYPLLLFVIILVALADTTAYFVGRRFGKHKLALHVSPGKTWEGVLGAIFMVMLLVVPLAKLFGIKVSSIGGLLLLGFVTVVAAIVGDLFESLVKRLANVKDSGTLLPGHGGILDRIDAYTAAIPIFMAVYFVLAA